MTEKLLRPSVSIREFFEYAPIRDRIPVKVRERVLDKVEAVDETTVPNESPIRYGNHSDSLYSLDEHLFSKVGQLEAHLADKCQLQILLHMDLYLRGKENASALSDELRQFVVNRQTEPDSDLKTMRRAAVAPFAFCNRLVNDLRSVLQVGFSARREAIKCRNFVNYPSICSLHLFALIP